MVRVQIRCFFWSVFSGIWTEHGDLIHKSPYSVQIQENTDQKKLRIWSLVTELDYKSTDFIAWMIHKTCGVLFHWLAQMFWYVTVSRLYYVSVVNMNSRIVLFYLAFLRISWSHNDLRIWGDRVLVSLNIFNMTVWWHNLTPKRNWLCHVY